MSLLLEEAYKVRHRALNMANKILQSNSLAEDAVSVTYISILKYGDESWKGEASFFNWYASLVKNAAIKILNKERRSCELNDNMDEPYDFTEKDDRPRLLNNAIMELPKKQRESFLLFYWEGFRAKEIAEHTGENLDTIKANARHGLMKLKTQFR